MRLGGGSASGATDATVLVVGSGVAGRSGTEATTGEVSRSVGSSETSGLAETVKRQRQCEPAERWCAVGQGPRLATWQHGLSAPLLRTAHCAPRTALLQQAAGVVRSQAAGWRSGGQQQWPVAWPRQSWPVSQRQAPPCARAAFASARSSTTICAIRICRRRIGMGFVRAGLAPALLAARSMIGRPRARWPGSTKMQHAARSTQPRQERDKGALPCPVLSLRAACCVLPYCVEAWTNCCT
jgi:hypothetical protein